MRQSQFHSQETLVQDADTPDRKRIVYFSYSGVTKGIAERLQQNRR